MDNALVVASLPALFYLSVAGQHISKGQDSWNLNMAVIGVAWAVSSGAFFLTPARSAPPCRTASARNS